MKGDNKMKEFDELENLEELDSEEDEDVTEKSSKENKRLGKKSMFREVLDWIITFAVVYIIATLIVTYVGQRTIVDGSSMENTLQDGDNLIVNKLTYVFDEPERFDIIIFHYSENVEYIKRIIGLPGETIQIVDGTIYINGEILEESYGKEKMMYDGIAAAEIELGEDEYFVLGDNRNHSKDSRDALVGKVNKSQIVGKALIRIWPLGDFSLYD